MTLTKPALLAAFHREGTAFRAAISPEQLGVGVPSCPGWTVQDLVAHVGVSYLWHCEHLVRGVTSRPEHPRVQAPAGEAVLPWWDESFVKLGSVLESLDADAPAWNWSLKPRTAAFWHRCLSHETAMHRWDAQLAAGRPEPIDVDLAADGVDEVLDSYLPTKWAERGVDLNGVVRVEATDRDVHWLVRVRPTGVSLLDTGGWFDTEPDVHAEVRGTASDLNLLLWGRIPLSVLNSRGEPGLIMVLGAENAVDIH